jgi:hypothetical protein
LPAPASYEGAILRLPAYAGKEPARRFAGDAQGIEVEILFCPPWRAKKIGTDSPVSPGGADAPEFLILTEKRL